MSAVRGGNTMDEPGGLRNDRDFQSQRRLENTSECCLPRGIKAALIFYLGWGRRDVPMTLRLQKSPTRIWRGKTLLAEAQPLHHVFVAIRIVSLEVVQQASPLADQHEKTAARAMIFLVCFEVLRQLTDPLT